MDQIAQRFGQRSEVRQAELESLRWLVDLVKRIGAQRLIIDGSFVTDVLEPNDVDCVVLIAANAAKDTAAESELLAGLPFLEVKLVRPRAFKVFVDRIFATDRLGRPKGMIEVSL